MPRDSNIRVRFAPSPTGEPHLGSVRTALFNWLYARHAGGTFILRIEDTDQKRLVPGSSEKILEALDWYGLTPDEGPAQGGPYAPYVQSQRLDIYRKHADILLKNGSAYYCFCTPKRLAQLRTEQTASKRPPRYDKHCATLSPDEVAKRRKAGETCVIRLKLPFSGTIEHVDLIRRKVSFRYDVLDDSVIVKSDGWPTYHLANVVDDHLMKISHVIRAEEWLPSIPKHLWLYQAFGWPPPQFAHLPLLLGADRSKLSKRHGAASALSFRDDGYLAEAMVNFMALMGWHPKGEDELLTRQQIIAQFNLEGVNPAGAVFDRTKLDWMNGEYIRALDVKQLLHQVRPFWTIPTAEQADEAWLMKALALVRERMKTWRGVNDINTVFTSVWDERRRNFDASMLVPKQGTMESTRHHLQQTVNWLNKYDGDWITSELKKAMLSAIASAGKKNNEILWPLRVALSLQAASPDVFDLLALLGKRESLRRLASFRQG
ncbi:MAG: glutamate--tRNA ligase [Patescibacteria group bacterium]